MVTTYGVQVHPYIYNKYLWEVLANELSTGEIQVSTVSMKLIFHCAENSHIHIIIYGILCVFAKQRIERTNPWIASGQCISGAIHGVQNPESALSSPEQGMSEHSCRSSGLFSLSF